jgi:hypothetical protein
MALTKAHNRMVAGSRINVLDFGATGDGTTDDTAAIQAAIDEAYVSGNFDNKSVFLPTPPSGYKITSTLNLYQRVALIGEDKWNCKILVSGQILGIENPRLIENIWFDGGSIQNPVDLNKLIHKASWSRTTDRANTAILLGPADGSFEGGHAIIKECRFTAFGVAIEGPNCINSEIHGCYFQTGYHDIYFRADNNNSFASAIVSQKNYHSGAQGVGLGFYTNSNGYQGVDVSYSVFENLCTVETTLGFIDTSSGAGVKGLGGTNVYFEVGDKVTYPNQKAIICNAFYAEGCYFNGFNRIIQTATATEFYQFQNSEFANSTGTYDIVFSTTTGRSFFRNVAFSAGLDPATLGKTTIIDCSGLDTSILPDGNTNMYINDGQFEVRKGGGIAVVANRASNDGTVIDVQRNGTSVGTLGGDASRLAIGSANEMLITQNNTTARTLFFESSAFRPTNSDNNTLSLGSGSARWTEVFATNGTINTSDENQKQNIRDITDAEKAVATALKGQMKAFKFRDAVTAKGEDGARIHFGVIAQTVRDAFVAEGLDPTQYGVFCSDTWTDDDGNEQTVLGVRYEELFAFIISTL